MIDNLLSIPATCLFGDQGNLLLVRKRGIQTFILPGGKRELGEAPLATLQRELLEELRPPMGALTLEHLGSFQTSAVNEANTRVDTDIYAAHLPYAVRAQAELEELAWPVPGQAQPDSLAPLLRDHVLPTLARCATENPEIQAEHWAYPDHVR